MKQVFRIALIVLLVATSASAQVWRGSGRLDGKVTDDAGKPIEGVTVKLAMPAEKGLFETKTNAKGEWRQGGMGRGEWQLDFVKQGYETRNISSSVAETSRNATIEITLKKAEDPNEIIANELKTAADLINQKKYAEARAIYEAVLARFPTAYRVEQLIARVYYLEGQPEKAIERLKAVMARDPNAQEVKLLLGSLLLEQGKAEEGKQVLASVDDAKIVDPAIYVNFGIAMMNKNQAAEAITYFEKAITRFPSAPDAYYYRGICTLQVAGAAADESAKAASYQRVKADLAKFLEMAPKALEAEAARKILEQLK